MNCKSLVALLALAGLVATASHAAVRVAEPTFTLPSDPAEIVVRLSFLGSMTPTRIDYTLYGDGRLEKVVTDAAYPTKRREVLLTEEEMRGLMRSAVLHGLASTAQQELTSKMRAAAEKAQAPGAPRVVTPPPADASTAELQLNLKSYGAKGKAVSNRLSVQGLDAAASGYPDLPELQEWLQLLKDFDLLFLAAESKP